MLILSPNPLGGIVALGVSSPRCLGLESFSPLTLSEMVGGNSTQYHLQSLPSQLHLSGVMGRRSLYPSAAPLASPPGYDNVYTEDDWSQIIDSVPLPPDNQLLDLLNSLDLYQDEDSMNSMCNNDMLFSELGNDHAHLTTDLPQAMRVSMSGEEGGLHNLLTPPESPVFAELTPPNSQLKCVAPMFQDAVVPNLKYEPIDACNLNTMCSPLYQEYTISSHEGMICDVPFGTSCQVLPKEEPDFNDYFPGAIAESAAPPWNLHEYVELEDYPPTTQQMSTFDCPKIDTLPNVEMLFKNLTDYHRPLATNCPLRSQNSAGEETECESESSFTLSSSPTITDDSDLTMSPLSHANRTHNYQRKTIDKSVSLFCGVTSKSHKRGRGRPRKMHSLSSTCSDDSDEEVTTRRGRGRREAMRGNHLWEFIRDLLKDSAYCPKYIRFESRKEGVFRFVNSEAVAKLWGRKKNNPNMTYEKLSRAMRYYYKREILERVDGRRLVYKFGKNATGWREAAGYASDADSS